MEGYSVTEAASVLGVPTERVWELLARGVLSGAPEGETGMRVYLQPRPAPAPVEARGPNGDGGAREPERELSPFRELLTEFRNLTERYGQALLALGEARGEVASLRSRVDLLEARMDLRLPMGQPQPAGWSPTPMPPPVERAVMPAATVEPPPTGQHEAAEEEERRARARGPRRATESFAEALARAQDPSPPELPAPADSAGTAGQRQQSDAGADVGLPREAAGADEIPVADGADEVVAAAPDETAVVEGAIESVTPEAVVVEAAPEPVAVESEPEPVEPEPIELEPEPIETAPEPVAVEPEPIELEPEPIETAPEPVEVSAEPEPIAAAAEPVFDGPGPTFEPVEEPVPLVTDAAPPPGLEAPVEDEPEIAETEVTTGAAVGTGPEPQEAAEASGIGREAESVAAADAESAVAGVEIEPVAWDAERYTTDIEEPDWFAAEIDEAVSSAPIGDEPVVEPSSDQAEPATAAVTEEADAGPEPDAPVAEAGSALAADAEPVEVNGADEMEVAPTGTQPDARAVHRASARAFPGAQDLEEAIAALRAAGRAAEPPPEPEPHAETDQDGPNDEWPARSAFVRPPATGAATRGPASRAYRRLRRIFPG
jgi:nicotinate-nucleotide--dimethylbenzimidazole phosphoribosyltransferase